MIRKGSEFVSGVGLLASNIILVLSPLVGLSEKNCCEDLFSTITVALVGDIFTFRDTELSILRIKIEQAMVL